jgi:hypothetical protein
MAQTIRVSKPGYDALTDANIYNYSLYADSDNVLIKEKARGTGTVDLYGTATINHALNYIPFYLVYTEVASGRYRVNNAYEALSSGWMVNVTTADLTITNNISATYTDYKYYIFYDVIG